MLDRGVFVQGIYEELIEVINFFIYIIDTIDLTKRKFRQFCLETPGVVVFITPHILIFKSSFITS